MSFAPRASAAFSFRYSLGQRSESRSCPKYTMQSVWSQLENANQPYTARWTCAVLPMHNCTGAV